MNKQLKYILQRLKNPTVVLSIVSQIAAIFILFGFDINENLVLGVVACVCSILVTLGIMSNPDTKGYKDTLLQCESCGEKTLHVEAGGQLVCAHCGSVSTEAAAPEQL